jgi:ABC-type multidrug transport system fused ATPase/permease subunit
MFGSMKNPERAHGEPGEHALLSGEKKRFGGVGLHYASIVGSEPGDYGVEVVVESDPYPRESNIPVFEPFKWSNLIFSWYDKQIEIGEQRPLKMDDMLTLPPFLTSSEVYETFKKCWSLESLRCATANAGYASTEMRRPKLWRVLHTLIFTEFWLCGLCRLLNDIAVVLTTILIKYIIHAVEMRETSKAFALAVAILANSLFQAFALQQFIHGSFMSGSRVVSATTSVVYHATQSLRMHKMNPPKSVGEINNVQSKDTGKLRDTVVFFHNLWACPLQIIVCVGLLIHLLGMAGLVSFFMLAALIPVEKAIGKRARDARKKVSVHSDKRMAIVNEMIDGVQTVKLTNLCPFMYDKISRLRETELSAAWQGMLINIINLVITRSATLLITALTLTAYTLIPGNGALTSDRAFSALAVISILGRPMQVIPTSLSMLVDSMVSIDRIESIIVECEKYNCAIFAPKSFDETIVAAEDELAASLENESGQGAGNRAEAAARVVMRGVTAFRGAPNSVVVLTNMSLDISQPGLVVITGGNASGKTSLLLSILNELNFHVGAATITPKRCVVAYSGHDPWIVNASAKDNILIASKLNVKDDLKAVTIHRQSYHDAIQACALVHDFNIWADGDGTLIGEKGVNISGGQRQRISLARALVSEAQVSIIFDFL